MYNKCLVKLIVILLMIPLISGAYISLGTFKSGDNVTLIQICDDCTYNNITSLIYPNGTIVLEDIEMIADESQFTYVLEGKYTTDTYGTYYVNGVGDDGGTNVVWAYTFDVNSVGTPFTTEKAITYCALIGVLFFIFIITLFGIAKLPNRNERDGEGRLLSISYLKYFRDVLWLFEWMLILIILFASSNLAFAFLGEQMFAKILFNIFTISFRLTPVIVIVWLIWIFVSMFHDKQLQNLLNKGIFPRGNL